MVAKRDRVMDHSKSLIMRSETVSPCAVPPTWNAIMPEKFFIWRLASSCCGWLAKPG